MAIKFNRNFSIGRVVKRLVYTILSLYVGGQIITEFGNAMLCTHSPFYRGLTLIGWTVQSSVVMNASDATITNCNTTTPINGVVAGTFNNVIATTTGTGVLSVVGIIGIAGVVMEFVQF